MHQLKFRMFLVLIISLVVSLGEVTRAAAANEVYLSNDADQSVVTYILNVQPVANGAVRRFRITLPPGTNAANARLGRFVVGTTDFSTTGTLTVDPLDSNTLIAEMASQLNIKNLTSRIELLNLSNPLPGSYSIDVRTLNNQNNVVEVIPPIAFSVFEVGPGDITAVNAGAGLTGGGTSGDVTLSVNTSQIQSRVVGVCPPGSSIRQIDASGNVVCQIDANSGGTVASVDTGSGLTGGPIIAAGTISIATGGVTSTHIADGTVGSADVNSAQIQLRITGTCPAGNAIQVVNADGTVTCEPSGGIAGSGTMNTVPKFTGATAVGNSQIFDNGTNVGVGTATPGAKLDVAGAVNTSTQYNIGGSRVLGVGLFNQNTAVGINTLVINTTGQQNTATGAFAMQQNTTGTQNTATGREALFNNTSGGSNTGTGVQALFSNTTGNNNTAAGFGALFANTNGAQNTAAGAQALFSNTGGTINTAAGFGALQSNTLGGQNTGLGAFALRNNTTGGDNAAVGADALRNNTTGTGNTAAGNFALRNNTTGMTNTAFGFQAGINATTGSNNIYVSNPGVAAESNTVRIGTQGTQTSTFIAGISGNNLVGNAVVINSNGQLGVGAGAASPIEFQGPWVLNTSYQQNDIVTYAGETWIAVVANTNGSNPPTLINTDWDLMAARGADGATGPQGPTGVTGATGSQGPAGPQGATGATGAQGPQGVQGETGAQGPIGLTGATGATGAQGIQGIQGPIGLTGPQGPAGSANIAGTTNSIIKFTGTNSGSDSQIFDNGTSVGVGTATPSGTAKLDVAGVINASTQYNLGGNRVLALGTESTAIGINALVNTTAVGNTALGFRALELNNGGGYNTAVGHAALRANTSGGFNVAAGTGALTDNTTGHDNIAVGFRALLNNTTGSGNTALGSNTLIASITAVNNTAVGLNALRLNTIGTQNTASGVSALENTTTGNNNTASGVNALNGNISGSNNTALGNDALLNNTADRNTAVGESALRANTSGVNNTATGRLALYSNTTGLNNTATGLQALQENTTGIENTAVGVNALRFNTTGNNNLAIGYQALEFNTNGVNNVAVGTSALITNITGDQNTAIGLNSDVSSANLTNATAIGFGAIVNASNKVRLGNTSVTDVEGQVAYSFSSDKTKKENFRPVDAEDVLTKIRELSVPSWNYIGHDPERFRHYGPMAQDFFAAFGNDGVGTIGTPTTINSGDMAGILMIAVQALEKRTRELKAKDARIVALEKETAELRAKQSYFETVAARLDTLELKLNQPVRVKAETTTSDETSRLDR